MHSQEHNVAQSRFREFVRWAITRDSEKSVIQLVSQSVSQSVTDHRVYYVNYFIFFFAEILVKDTKKDENERDKNRVMFNVIVTGSVMVIKLIIYYW